MSSIKLIPLLISFFALFAVIANALPVLNTDLDLTGGSELITRPKSDPHGSDLTSGKTVNYLPDVDDAERIKFIPASAQHPPPPCKKCKGKGKQVISADAQVHPPNLEELANEADDDHFSYLPARDLNEAEHIKSIPASAQHPPPPCKGCNDKGKYKKGKPKNGKKRPNNDKGKQVIPADAQVSPRTTEQSDNKVENSYSSEVDESEHIKLIPVSQQTPASPPCPKFKPKDRATNGRGTGIWKEIPPINEQISPRAIEQSDIKLANDDTNHASELDKSEHIKSIPASAQQPPPPCKNCGSKSKDNHKNAGKDKKGKGKQVNNDLDDNHNDLLAEDQPLDANNLDKQNSIPAALQPHRPKGRLLTMAV